MSENEPTITVRKIGYTMPVSFEILIDAGAMTEEEALAAGWVRPEPIHISWHRRLRWRLQSWWWEHKPHLHFGPCGVDYE